MLEGYIDQCKADFIAGWAWDNARPEARIMVEIIANGKSVAHLVAQKYREDLKMAGIGDGAHAFEYAPASSIDISAHDICVIIADTDVYLPRSRQNTPVPPDDMIFRVAGHLDVTAFVSSGASCMGLFRCVF
jgi:hypothetical protein